MARDVKNRVAMINGYAEDDPRLACEVVAMIGDGVDASRWVRKPMALGELIALSATHREGPKEGLAVVFGDFVGSRRKKDKVEAVYALGLDLDGSPLTGPELDSKLAELGFLAVRATTHSHGRKGERHRVILPLAEPFRPRDHDSIREAERQWRAILKTVGARLGVEPDKACCDLARAYYLPRHAAGAPWESTIVGGRLLDLARLDLSAALARPERKPRTAAVTAGGADLAAWGKRRADTFLITRAIEDHCPEVIRSEVAQGLEIECPNDAEHSNAGDPADRACLVRDAPDNPEGERFVVRCQHAHCQDLGPLDMLGMMIGSGWIPREALDDDAYHVEVETPGLTTESSTEEVEAAIRSALKLAPGEAEAERALAAVRSAAKLSASAFKTILGRVRGEAKAEAREKASPPVSKAEGARLAADYPPPTGERGAFSYRSYDGRPWLHVDQGGDKGLLRLWTPWTIDAGLIEVDNEGKQGVRLAALDQDGERSVFTVTAADAFTGAGLPLKTRLREAGVGMTDDGEFMAVRWIREHAPANPTRLYERPGWRGRGLFITPWGSASVPMNQEVELAESVMPKGREVAGTLAGWKAATAAAWGADVLHFKLAPLIAWGSVLVDLCEADSCWLALTGSTSRGKTTTAKLMAAVWGDTRERMGLWGPLNGTDAAAEARLAQGSGAGFAFDETALVTGDRLQTLIFTGSAGAGRDRMKRSAELRSSRTWRAMYLITGEHDLMRKIRASGVATTTGVGTRVLELDCEAAPDLAPEVIEAIEAAYDHHGQAGRAYVRALIDGGHDRDPERLWGEVEMLAADLAGAGAKPPTIRAARIAAIMWRAGQLAHDAGLLPNWADVEGAIRQLWAKAQESDLAPRSAEDVAVRTLFEFLIRNRGGRVAEGLGGDRREVDAWRLSPADYGPKDWPAAWPEPRPDCRDDPDTAVYVVASDALSRLAGGALNDRALEKALDGRGALIRGRQNRRTWDYVAKLGKVTAVVIPANAIEQEGAEYEGRPKAEPPRLRLAA
ncbi:MAG TPA: DUF927 domain-containing protein [Brevundimonas sp.]|uniref:DUF927 domain-containing protein n=1 Tax=Brevundimonas sp. TaxID=1871086 RepID=UPI002E11B97D|nr:DUF927 domain-containing protein [Brevundimonas sp.]